MQGILGLSDSQIQDLMFVRRVYILRKHELDLHQAALLASVQEHSSGTLSDIPRVTELANQIRLTAAEHHLLVQRFGWAMYMGVRTHPLTSVHNIHLLNFHDSRALCARCVLSWHPCMSCMYA